MMRLRGFSFAPPGLVTSIALFPTACAVGCILSPLCGWGLSFGLWLSANDGAF
jgi:hypothetical protein